ncbi:MAG: ParB/RepB/Spo0J family partition protein [Chloroflexi bacterium]|nr:ParB/RepB/Spo0J family partition protein [Chloroflexota bacterium]
MAKRRGLGRGLGALIPTSTQKTETSGLLEVAITAIVRNPRQPRHQMDQQLLEELSASIREHGVLQPLVVTRLDHEGDAEDVTHYQLIAGERRWTAARMAGLTRIPVVVKEATPQQLLEIALVENVQRADLNVLEEALAYQQLSKEFGLSQEEIAEKVGKSRVAVANTMRLLRLPADIQALVSEGSLSEGHARALLMVKDEDEQRKLAQQALSRGLTVREVEALARQAGKPKETPSKRTVSEDEDADVSDIEGQIRRALGTKVQLARGRRGGKLIIYFYSEEELERIFDLLVGQT